MLTDLTYLTYLPDLTIYETIEWINLGALAFEGSFGKNIHCLVSNAKMGMLSEVLSEFLVMKYFEN